MSVYVKQAATGTGSKVGSPFDSEKAGKAKRIPKYQLVRSVSLMFQRCVKS